MLDNTIKQVVIEVITNRLETVKGNQFKNVGKTIPLQHTDLESIQKAFEEAYNTDGYVNGSACVCDDQDGYIYNGSMYVYYEVKVETTDKEREKQVIDRINKNLHFKLIYDKLIALGYKRVWADFQKLKAFDDTNIYSMFKNDQDRLTSYYMLYFTKD